MRLQVALAMRRSIGEVDAERAARGDVVVDFGIDSVLSRDTADRPQNDDVVLKPIGVAMVKGKERKGDRSLHARLNRYTFG